MNTVEPTGGGAMPTGQPSILDIIDRLAELQGKLTVGALAADSLAKIRPMASGLGAHIWDVSDELTSIRNRLKALYTEGGAHAVV